MNLSRGAAWTLACAVFVMPAWAADSSPDTDNAYTFPNAGTDASAMEPGITPDSAVYSFPIQTTDVAFDPIRPLLYLSDMPSQKVYFLNLNTLSIEREFSFTTWPESLALTPDSSRLFAALLTRGHSRFWFDGTHQGYIASFDLSTQLKDREFLIAEDPGDLIATTDGHLVVPSGSGQNSYIRVFDAVTGAQTGAYHFISALSRVALHPSEQRIYSADTGVSPSNIERYDLTPGGGITLRWQSPYHGEHRMDGNVWVSPFGDRLITRGGDLFWAGDATTDMRYISPFSTGTVTALAWDAPRRAIFTIEGSVLRYYNLVSMLEIGSQTLPGNASFVGVTSDGAHVVAVMADAAATRVVMVTHPAPGGATNTPPLARLTLSPGSDLTTMTDIVFDASASSDDQDVSSSLRFRWDLEGDGTWDTPFQASPTITQRYNTAGTRIARVQVRDALALVSEATLSIDVAFKNDPGSPGPSHVPFVLPFYPDDAVFDPVRPYLYTARRYSRKVDFVNLMTGLIEKEFSFSANPADLALTPDGTRLFVTLDGNLTAFAASFDLEAGHKDREVRIPDNPLDLLATKDGHILAGFGQYGRNLLCFDAVTGAQTGFSNNNLYYSRLEQHPSGQRIYSSTNGLIPNSINRYDLLSNGSVTSRWSKSATQVGSIWVSPLGDRLITGAGDLFTSGATQAADLQYVSKLSSVGIRALAWDPARQVVFTMEGQTLRYYNLVSMVEIGSQPIGNDVTYIGVSTDGSNVYLVIPRVSSAEILTLPYPAPGGASSASAK